MGTRQHFPCPPSPSLLPCSSALFLLLHAGVDALPGEAAVVPSPGRGSLEAEPPRMSPGGGADSARRAGEPAAAALRGFTAEIRHSAELPPVIAPLTIRGCAGNLGAADRYTALIQLSLQPLLAKIRGNWYYK